MFSELTNYPHQILENNGVKIILINGDSYEVIKNIQDKSIDLVITDPPYSLDKQDCSGTSRLALQIKKHISNNVCQTDLADGFNYSIFTDFDRICKVPNYLIFCSNKQVAELMSLYDHNMYSNTLLVWHKTNAIPTVNKKYWSNLEFIVSIKKTGSGTYFNNNVSYLEKSKLYSSPITSGKRFHPTQKTEGVINWLLNIRAKEGDLVLDPFAGSATTAVVCYKRKVNCICIEKDTDYYNKSVERLNIHKEYWEVIEQYYDEEENMTIERVIPECSKGVEND